jgi:hypothetical protein
MGGNQGLNCPPQYFQKTEGQLHEGQKSFKVEGTSCQESKAVAANAASGVISELRHLGAPPTACMAKQGRARSMWPRPWPMVSSTASPLSLNLVGLNDPGEAKRPQAVASRVDLGQEERAQRQRCTTRSLVVKVALRASYDRSPWRNM